MPLPTSDIVDDTDFCRACKGTGDDHRDLFPLGGNSGPVGMRRIGVVCRVLTIAQNLWSWRPVRGVTTLEDAISESLCRCHPTHDVRLAIDDYFAAYAPLSTDVRAMDTDDRRALMSLIMADAREDEAKYRARLPAYRNATGAA